MSLSPIPWSAISPLFLLLLPIMAVAVDEPGLQIKYNGYKLYRLDLSREEHRLGQVLELLEQLEAGGSRFNANGERMPLLDVWTDLASGSKKHQSQIEALVAPEFCTDFLNLLHDKGVPRPQLMNEDIQIQIDREKREIIQRRRRHRRRVPVIQGNIAKGIDLNSYNSYRSITDYLTKLAAEHPRLVQLINFTRTFEGRDLLGVKGVGKRDDGQDARKPLVFIDAGVHAREWIAPAAALYVLDKMVSVASKSMDPTMPSDMETQQMAALLDRLQFVFLPVGNPDGYEYSRNRDRLWRKTRSRNESMHRGCVGADANRNWGYRWAETGASRSPCSNIFPGWAPFSEPEVEAVRAFLAPQLGRLAAYISLHSYGQLILSPWGYTTEKPDNFGEQRKLAELAAQAIRESTGARYTFGSIADLLYPASGTSIDYWQHKGVPYIYGVELRPEDVETELHGFAIPPDQIEPTGKEMAVFVKRVGEYLLQRKEKTLLEKEAEMSPIAVGS